MVIFNSMTSYVHYCLAPHMENNGGCDLVDEKGSHDDILKFASKADIVVCCLAMNSETVRFHFVLFLVILFPRKLYGRVKLIATILFLQAGIVNNDFLSSMRKVCNLLKNFLCLKEKICLSVFSLVPISTIDTRIRDAYL